MFQFISLAILLLSLAYLTWRSVDVLLRQYRSFQLLPFTQRALPTIPNGGRADRAAGALAGVALGDACGMPREQVPPKLARLRWGDDPCLSRGLFRFARRAGTISDDTQLTLAVARSLTRDGRFLKTWFCVELVRWWPARVGPGRATAAAVRRMRRGDAQSGDPDSQGNGAAMRVVPIAVALRDDPSAMIEACISSARPTHRNSEAIAGAEAVARLVATCLRWHERPEQLADALTADDVIPRRTSHRVDRWRSLLEQAIRIARQSDTPEEDLKAIGTSGWVFETLPAVVFLLVRHPEDYRAGLRCLYRVGGDVDTIGALYCSCLGALRGLEAFEDVDLRDIQSMGELFHHSLRLTGHRRPAFQREAEPATPRFRDSGAPGAFETAGGD